MILPKLGYDGLKGGLISLLYTLPGSFILVSGMGIYFVTSMLVPLHHGYGTLAHADYQHYSSQYRWLSAPASSNGVYVPGFNLAVGRGIVFIAPLRLSHFVAKNIV